QAQQPVDFVHPGGGHNDGHAALAANFPAQRQAVDIGQVKVQQNQLRPVCLQPGQNLGTILKTLSPVAFTLQVFVQQLCQLGLVFDDENLRCCHGWVDS